MANQPREIIFDILSRLPAKSLIRFRCVCKSWRSLISDPQFVKTHLHRAITEVDVCCQRVLLPTSPFFQSIDFEALNNGYTYASSSMVLDFLAMYFDADLDIVSVLGSCNGLVFLMVDCDKICLCNPCTRESRELPMPSNMPPDNDFCAIGFGYDSSIDDYKVVIIASPPAYSSGNNNTQMKVFSLKSNSWKRVEDIHASIRFDVEQGVFVEGSLYWIASCCGSDGTRDRMIVSFNLATEEFGKLMPIPPHQSDWNYLIVLGGCLSVVCDYYTTSEFEVWIMKQYGVEASWTKLFVYQMRYRYMVPLCLSKDGEVLLDSDGIELKMYNPEDMTYSYRNLDVLGHWEYSKPAVYFETLVSPINNVEN